MWPFIHLGGIRIPIYGVCFSLGILTSTLLLRGMLARRGFAPALGARLALLILALVAVGGRLGSMLVSQPGTASLQSGGYSVLGSILAIAIVVPLYLRWMEREARWREILDVISFAYLPAQIIGKAGCFAAGCCFGSETHGPWAVVYRAPYCVAPVGVALHPTQLYEGGVLILLFLFLCAFHRRLRFAPGNMMAFVLVVKGVERFFFEYLRGDAVPAYVGLTRSQVGAIACVLLGIALGCHRPQKPDGAP